MCTQIERVDKKVALAVADEERVQQLTTVPSVGPVTAVSFIALVDDIVRFESADKLQSYLGLVLREYSSGEKQQRGHITKTGNSRMRSLLVACAWGILRRQNSSSELLGNWAMRIAARRGKHIAALALARLLSISLIPHRVVLPASRALEFYNTVFGAKVRDVNRAGDLIAHAVLAFPSGQLTRSDALPSYELVAPSATGPVSYSLALYVTNCDQVVERAVNSGAPLREPASTSVSGDRYASIRDPFGVRWAVMTRVEDLPFEESAAHVAEWAKEAMGQG